MKLAADTLGNLSPEIVVPGYDRAALSHGIVHVGLGNFHRAHQAVYLDDLFAKGLDHDWALTGAGVRAPDGAMRQMLKEQDFLSTVIELDPAGTRARVIGAMIDFIEVDADNGPLIDRMTDEATRIVSLTVTEGGYFVSADTGTFDPSHPDIVADAARPEAPHTVFGAIVAALKARRAAGLAPFTVMSCDNLPGNGDVTRDAVVGFAQLIDLDLADWIEGQVAFPNGMVDRITPATGEGERALAARFGLDDPVPVTCEPFRQWVLEDKFPLGRPRLEEVGVTFTDDVHAYERMKIRILNGGHAVIAYPGALLGCELAHDAMAHPLVHAFFRKVEAEEILPHVHAVPEFTPEQYLELIDARFSNPAIKDTTRRLCLDGSNRQPKFIVPSVRDGLAAGISVDGLALLSALWCRYCIGHIEDGTAVAPNDPSWERLTATAARAKDTPMAWLEMRDVYGDLAQVPAFAGRFADWLGLIWAQGTEAALNAYLKEQ
ncbi:mannitol dehydrogenase family protein [Pseudooceanicola sediminis]|uniref:Mannitol dehydrogenase family protein n=1 Tax=Pseudooceanicola sediminis TaxID=2211117 RepID=A0A399J5E7_9RHOB|nr:mannitol dehydrogenase family protein [Pseudooceanicola sediminis]KAA2316844.1 mannitol dehydrogenase family protein [Puniceibacterium sp. HSS470]RII40698.1 mannitol dehydrogenase family protein [Pseudooceanicola sediminis]|tara:strand:- start:167188 stop:168657 length:1470 start_codon:yes stop_codon:yes gene_type:complete